MHSINGNKGTYQVTSCNVFMLTGTKKSWDMNRVQLCCEVLVVQSTLNCEFEKGHMQAFLHTCPHPAGILLYSFCFPLHIWHIASHDSQCRKLKTLCFPGGSFAKCKLKLGLERNKK